MPSRKLVRRRRPRRRLRGGSFWTKLKKFGLNANKWLRKNKIISNSAKIAKLVGVPHAGIIGAAASMGGYGKRGRRKCAKYCRRKGRGLNPGGGALRLAGAGYYRSKKARYRSAPIGY